MAATADRSYQVLARKWRPQRFADLAGLEHIARTLQNAIRRRRVAHAFLFTGTRGVGKTSAARILAKALNCLRGDEPLPEPCNQCASCTAITAGTSPDVVEIDGASNRGIAEIRQLRENIGYLPQLSRYKIYIIDEVHMLTSEAFNALLKTLEEPPDHVKFIMATTEPHKVPITILSRCQRYDFGRLSASVIEATLAAVAGHEGIDIDPAALQLLAREAEGSMRDALSVFDQVIACADGRIDLGVVRQVLGVVEARSCAELVTSLLDGELPRALAALDELERGGIDLKRFARDLLFYLRNLVLVSLSPELQPLVDVSREEFAELQAIAGRARLTYWQQLFDLFQEQFAAIVGAAMPRLVFEMTLVRLGMARDLEPVADLIARLERSAIGPGMLTTAAGPGALASDPGLKPAAADAAAAASGSSPGRNSAPVVTVAGESMGNHVDEGTAPVPYGAAAEVASPAALTAHTSGGRGAVNPPPVQDWPALLAGLKAKLPLIGSLLEEAELVELAADRLILRLPDWIHGLIHQDDRETRLQAQLEEQFGRPVNLVLQRVENGGGAGAAAVRREPPPGINKQQVLDDEIVRCFVDEFDARLDDIRPL